MTLKLATLRFKIKFSSFWLYIEYKAVTLINCRVLPNICYLFFPKNKENVTFDKFVIYVPIRRYGYYNTLQQPVHPSAMASGFTWLLQGIKISISTDRNVNNKRILHDIFHIGPGISPRLPYQTRQRSWRADMGRGLIPGTIWKISCHNLFITYFTLTLSKH